MRVCVCVCVSCGHLSTSAAVYSAGSRSGIPAGMRYFRDEGGFPGKHTRMVINCLIPLVIVEGCDLAPDGSVVNCLVLPLRMEGAMLGQTAAWEIAPYPLVVEGVIVLIQQHG